MIWLGLAFGASLQDVKALEWQRAPAAEIAATVGDVPVRVAVAEALGRLRSADALAPLLAMRGEDPRTDRAIAQALGQTPGSGPAVAGWLADLPPAAPSFAERYRRREGVRVRLIRSLGQRGGQAAVAPLLAELGAAWPDGPVAAEALGQLGRRGVAQGGASADALAGQLGRRDPRVVRAAAFGLSRLGLQGANPKTVTLVLERARSAADADARRFLLQAAGSVAQAAERDKLLSDLVMDRARGVQVAALALAGPGTPLELVAPFVYSQDSWVRTAATRALGRMADDASVEALHRLTVDADPWDQAEALRALVAAGATLDTSGADDGDLPGVVRAALVGAITAPARLELLAADASAMVRSAAAVRLTELELAAPLPLAERLLDSSDAVVREIALELLAKVPARAVVSTLIPRLRVETSEAVLVAGFERLGALVETDPGSLRQPALQDVLERAMLLPSQGVHRAALGLAQTVGVTLPPAYRAPVANGTSQIVLPDGSVQAVSAHGPVLALVQRNAIARVQTNRGELRIALNPLVAPLAVSTFSQLASQGFYDGQLVHRLEPAFVVQTGCPRADGWGGSGASHPDEVGSADFSAGTVGMARGGYDSAGSQWFVVTEDAPHLQGEYTAFGKVISGMSVVRSLRAGDQILDLVIERPR